MLDSGIDVAPLVLLRDPVKRAVSHFYFLKNMPWTTDSRMRQQNLSEYLSDEASMLETRDIWQDGQAAASWLAATHIGTSKAPLEGRVPTFVICHNPLSSRAPRL